jgi:PAS domain S-box-containing protein
MDQQEQDRREASDRLKQENRELRAALEDSENGRALLRQGEELSRLLAASRLVVSELDLGKVLALVAEKAREIVEAELVLIPMLTMERDRYVYMEAAGDFADQILGQSFPVHVGMCGWVLQHERSLLFGDANQFAMDEKTVWEEGQQSAVLVPLFGRHKIIGGLSALGKRGGGSFTQHDLDLLTIFANQVSSAIENAILFQNLAKEIDERKQAEATLRESEQRFRLLVEQAPDAIAVYDLDRDCFVDANANAVRLFGCTREELLRQGPRPFFAEEQPDGLPVAQSMQLHFDRVLAGEAVEFQRLIHNAEGKELLCETRLVLLPSATKRLVRCSYLDVTARKKLEDQLRQSQKMESVGHLAGGIAHDFNNILTAIIGYANLLEYKVGDHSELMEFITPIIKSAKRAAELTHQILAFSRKQMLSPKKTELNGLIRGMQNLLRRLIGEDITIQTQCCDQELLVMVDPGQIEQVIMNISTNARDAMPAGGTLSISTSMIKLDGQQVGNYELGAPGLYAQISISDTGIGMDARTSQQIFEPFFTTKEVGKGTGLGLSIVYGIVKQHNGQVTVYSEPGIGTTFKIYLPLLQKEEPASAEFKSAPELPRQGSETILLAEDNEDVRKLVNRVLSDYGYKVIAAVDGEEAISLFTRDQKDIRLVLLDVVMPKKSGKEVCNAIRQIRPEVKILFMSGYTADIISSKGIMEDGIDFISKPVSPNQLRVKVRELLEQS